MPPIIKRKVKFVFPQKPTYVLLVAKDHKTDKPTIMCAIRLSDNYVLEGGDIMYMPTYDEKANALTVMWNSNPGYRYEQVSAFPIYAEPDFSN